jgi:hypothetical protein
MVWPDFQKSRDFQCRATGKLLSLLRSKTMVIDLSRRHEASCTVHRYVFLSCDFQFCSLLLIHSCAEQPWSAILGPPLARPMISYSSPSSGCCCFAVKFLSRIVSQFQFGFGLLERLCLSCAAAPVGSSGPRVFFFFFGMPSRWIAPNGS